MRTAVTSFTFILAATLTSSALADAAPPAANAPVEYAVIAHISGADGGWDYASVDAVRGRLYIARSDAVMIALDPPSPSRCGTLESYSNVKLRSASPTPASRQ